MNENLNDQEAAEAAEAEAGAARDLMQMLADAVADGQDPQTVLAALSSEELAALEYGMRASEAQKAAERDAALSALAQNLLKLRSEAITHREQSGIELEWLEDEEAYQGIDDANRHEVAFGLRGRRMGLNNSYQMEGDRKTEANRSTVFLNITRGYVDTGAARIGDMLQPVDDRAWSFKPTPIPELKLNEIADSIQRLGILDEQQLEEYLVKKEVERIKAERKAMKMAQAAEKVVDDWHVQCQYHKEVRRVIDDAARIGTGILKGPFPVKRKAFKWKKGPRGNELHVETKIDPASKRIDPWDFYPDPACGENIHQGSYTWERDRITAKKLAELKGLPGYFDDKIDEALRQGPARHVVSHDKDTSADDDARQSQFELWYFYGTLKPSEVQATGALDGDDLAAQTIPVLVTMVNDMPIRVALNPLDDGSFPYDVFPWQVRVGMWAGRGIARQVRTPQRMINAATRNLMDNARWSAKPIIMMKKKGVSPAQGQKWGNADMYYVDGPEGAMQAARDFLAEVKIDSRQPELLAIVEFSLRMAEQISGLPMLLQGQDSSATPDTLGGQQMAQNNANGVLRRLAKNHDDYLTEPHIRRYYSWLMAYGDEFPEAQGDLQIDARGSSALVERDIQNQAILQMAPFLNDPEFRIKKDKWFAEWCKSQRLDPARFQYDDMEWEQVEAARAQQQAPEDPAVTRGKIDAAARIKVAQIMAQARSADVAADVQARRELELLKYANARQMTLDQARVEMGKEMMKDRRERDLAGANMAIKKAQGSGVDFPG